MAKAQAVEQPTAESFLAALRANQSDTELAKIGRYFKSGAGDYGEGDRFIGVRMGTVFALAKAHIGMSLIELEKLMESDIHEARAGAMSIMGQKAKSRTIGPDERRDLFELYLRRHDRINNWDLVDLAAVPVIGAYLRDKPRDVLFTLARSENMWERRTAIYAAMAFIGLGQLDEIYALADILRNDPQDLIHKATGGVLRFAGDRDPARLRAYLDAHAATMPRVMLRYALEHFDKDERAAYLAMGKA